jgi:hypothetical protein
MQTHSMTRRRRSVEATLNTLLWVPRLSAVALLIELIIPDSRKSRKVKRTLNEAGTRPVLIRALLSKESNEH